MSRIDETSGAICADNSDGSDYFARMARPPMGRFALRESETDRNTIPLKNLPTRNEFLDDAMTKNVHLMRVRWGYLVALVSIYAVYTQPTVATAASPVRQADFEPDYEASGFVSPAGMPSPEAYFQSVEQAGFFGNAPIASRIGGAHGSPMSGCDMPGCDGGYPGGCGCQSGGHGYPGGCGAGGCGPGGCGASGLFSGGYRPMCLFCANSGCGVCNSMSRFSPLAALRFLMPYGAAGLSTQRWYDFSADVMFLETSGAGGGQVLTTLGAGGDPVLRASDANDSGMAVGGRLSLALIVGPGGNIEVTYLGGNRWKGDAAVADDGMQLFSFLSEFGTTPPDGYDDTDRSLQQSASTLATFHSGEVNYRRRTVGPYGRFQWSGLGGIRYLRYDSDFEYMTVGNDIPTARFFEMRNSVDNEMIGAQIGGDLWWNVIPGVNVGVGVKGGPMGNHISRKSHVAANSIAPGSLSLSDRANKSVWMGELEATLMYRISHSWTLKSQYYLLSVDRVGYGFDTNAAESLVSGGATAIDPIQTRSLTISGFSIGAEYMW